METKAILEHLMVLLSHTGYGKINVTPPPSSLDTSFTLTAEKDNRLIGVFLGPEYIRFGGDIPILLNKFARDMAEKKISEKYILRGTLANYSLKPWDEVRTWEHFNYSLYLSVKCSRQAIGLPVYDKEDIIDSPFIGRKLIRLEDNSRFEVEKVNKYWRQGYYLGLLARNEAHSHVLLFWESLNCYDETVLELITRTRAKWLLENN